MDASWVTFDKTSGTGNSELQISVGRNRSNKRTTIVTVCAGTESAEIEIEQAASTTGTLSVTTGACTIKREKSGSKYKYTITAVSYTPLQQGIMFRVDIWLLKLVLCLEIHQVKLLEQ